MRTRDAPKLTASCQARTCATAWPKERFCARAERGREGGSGPSDRLQRSRSTPDPVTSRPAYQVGIVGEISGGDAAKSGKFSSRLKAGAAKSHARNRDLGASKLRSATREALARRYAPGATRHDLGPFEGFGPKIIRRPYRRKRGVGVFFQPGQPSFLAKQPARGKRLQSALQVLQVRTSHMKRTRHTRTQNSYTFSTQDRTPSNKSNKTSSFRSLLRLGQEPRRE